MKHFWLDEGQQALMDSATSTAGDYGYIGAFDVGKAWKTRVREMVGGEVKPTDYLRAFNLVGRVEFWSMKTRQTKRATALIRLNKNQAMMMKLRHGGSGTAWVCEDATGESWGNMLIAAKARGTGYRNRFSTACLDALLEGHSFGPTLANVASHADAVDEPLRRPFVWWKLWCWHEANDPAPRPPASRFYEAAVKYGKTVLESGESWAMPEETNGKLWARQFWEGCQQIGFRTMMGVDPNYQMVSLD